MPGLTDEQADAFLGERGHLMHLGTNGVDGMPRVVPIWFVFEGRMLWFTPRAKSAWLADLRADAAVCATIDESSGLIRKVVVRGHAELVHDLGEDDVWRDRYRRIAGRYTPAEFVDAYIADTIAEPRALYRLVIADSEVRTWRMPGRGEDPLAVWAKSYYHDGR